MADTPSRSMSVTVLSLVRAPHTLSKLIPLLPDPWPYDRLFAIVTSEQSCAVIPFDDDPLGFVSELKTPIFRATEKRMSCSSLSDTLRLSIKMLDAAPSWYTLATTSETVGSSSSVPDPAFESEVINPASDLSVIGAILSWRNWGVDFL